MNIYIQRILALDIAGSPSEWISLKQAGHYYASDLIAWAPGTTEFVLHGGRKHTGAQSTIRVSSIVAIKGKDFMVRNFNRVPGVSKEMLLRRDRFVCAYCAQRFREKDLEIEHILPSSRGGRDTWMNLVSACGACNDRKRDRTPEEAGMKLHYIPYVPNRYETFILRGRNILTDQMQFLLQGVSKESRLHGA